MPINNGGPAFPVQPLDAQGLPQMECHPGMTLRQWYAGKAMQGFVMSMKNDDKYEAENIAIASFLVADAMIAHEAKEAA